MHHGSRRILLALAISAPSVALGQAATSQLQASARIAGACIFSTAVVTLDFGTYDPVYTNKAAPLDATTSIGVRCSLDQTAHILLGQGLHPLVASSDAAPSRSVVSGVSNMRYDLYQDSERRVIWGNTSATGRLYTGTGLYDAVTVYGRVPEAQVPRQGRHTDTVVVIFTL